MFDESLKFPNSFLMIFFSLNVGLKPVKLSNIIPCCSASIAKFSGEINFFTSWVPDGSIFKISSAKYFPNNIPKRELLIVVNITSPPGQHKLEISDRNIYLSYTCSITSEAITKSNLFIAFSCLISKSLLVVIHL